MALMISDAERQGIGEALLIYIFRALNKPSRSSYFHTKLLDALLKSVKETNKLAMALSWANGTSFLKQFDRASPLEDHPDAPARAVADAYAGETFIVFSESAIKCIKSMTMQRRRQLESIAAMLFPDHDAIRGKEALFSDAKVATGDKGFAIREAERCVESSVLGKELGRSSDALKKLEESLEEVFSDPKLSPERREDLSNQLEDLLIGRLELEQPRINIELLVRLFRRCFAQAADYSAAGVVGNIAQNAATLLLGVPRT